MRLEPVFKFVAGIYQSMQVDIRAVYSAPASFYCFAEIWIKHPVLPLICDRVPGLYSPAGANYQVVDYQGQLISLIFISDYLIQHSPQEHLLFYLGHELGHLTCKGWGLVLEGDPEAEFYADWVGREYMQSIGQPDHIVYTALEQLDSLLLGYINYLTGNVSCSRSNRLSFNPTTEERLRSIARYQLAEVGVLGD